MYRSKKASEEESGEIRSDELLRKSVEIAGRSCWGCEVSGASYPESKTIEKSVGDLFEAKLAGRSQINSPVKPLEEAEKPIKLVVQGKNEFTNWILLLVVLSVSSTGLVLTRFVKQEDDLSKHQAPCSDTRHVDTCTAYYAGYMCPAILSSALFACIFGQIWKATLCVLDRTVSIRQIEAASTYGKPRESNYVLSSSCQVKGGKIYMGQGRFVDTRVSWTFTATVFFSLSALLCNLWVGYQMFSRSMSLHPCQTYGGEIRCPKSVQDPCYSKETCAVFGAMEASTGIHGAILIAVIGGLLYKAVRRSKGKWSDREGHHSPGDNRKQEENAGEVCEKA